MTTSSDNLTGKVLGTCKLERLIGRGGMSVVYLAQQARPSRHVAIKILLPNVPVGSSIHNEFLARFQYEADIIARLEHIHIIPIFECDEQEGLAYLVMPYLTGGSLRDLLLRHGPLSLQETMTYIEQAAGALDYAHAHGVIHRDLKPGNFLLHADGRLVLADFGIARIVQGNSTLTNTGILLGTPDYMAPEMALGRQIDHRTDIYELGIVLFQMLSGDVPFKGRTAFEVIEKHLEQLPPLLHQINPQIPPAVDTVVCKATAKRPGDRYESAGAMAQALRHAIHTANQSSMTVPYYAPLVLSSTSTVAYQASQATEYASKPGNGHAASPGTRTHPKASRDRRRRSRFWLVLVGMLLVIVVGISGILLVSAQAPQANPTQMANTVVTQFYGDINRWDYPAAFKLLKGGNYCSFVDGYEYTLHDNLSIGNITTNANGTLKVEISIQASEKLPWGTATTTYQGYETVGQENGTWKIVGGSLTKTKRISTTEPPPSASPNAAPPQQAQALIQQFHNDISNRNYPAAYNRWGSDFQNTTDYCKFINGYAHTLHDDVLFEEVTVLPDSTIQVVSIIFSTVETPSGTTKTSQQETYIVGQEHNAWKILRGTLS